jgi:signal transduction histidine kinase
MTNLQEDNAPLLGDDFFAVDETNLDTSQAPATTNDKWRILIVDDEDDIHQATQFTFAINKEYIYQGKKLEFLHAYTAQQAKELLHQYPDVAIILLDVVMETHDAGLKLVEYIRDTLQNHFVRIILRTGQPGYAPEQEVIVKYEINDYQNKTELSTLKLFTVVTASLRAYSDLQQLDLLRQHLEAKVSERTQELQAKYTEIVMLNHELEKLNQEKNEFLGIAAHDLKNPLSAILGLSEMIKRDYDTMPSEEVIDTAEMISQASRQMFELIMTFLDVNAIESGKLTLSLDQIDILPILQTLVENYEDRADAKKLILHFQPVATSYTAWVDKNIYRQVLDNLLSNAIKYSPYGRNIFIRINQHNQSICCEIQDEGPGLSESDKQKLFCKFTRLSPQPTGKEQSTGLGLFIVKKLVEAMNGKVWCDSELGRGATFVVELPASSG